MFFYYFRLSQWQSNFVHTPRYELRWWWEVFRWHLSFIDWHRCDSLLLQFPWNLCLWKALTKDIFHTQIQGIEIVIATPGRLIDVISRHAKSQTNPLWSIGHIQYCVMDEMDMMLSLGFRTQVEEIVELLGSPRQTLLFSATFPQSLESLAVSLLQVITTTIARIFAWWEITFFFFLNGTRLGCSKNPVVVVVGDPESPPPQTKQIILWVETKQKKFKLLELLSSPRHFKPPCLIFVSSCQVCVSVSVYPIITIIALHLLSVSVSHHNNHCISLSLSVCVELLLAVVCLFVFLLYLNAVNFRVLNF